MSPCWAVMRCGAFQAVSLSLELQTSHHFASICREVPCATPSPLSQVIILVCGAKSTRNCPL